MENGLLITHITWHINTDTYKFAAGLFNLKELTKWRCDLQNGLHQRLQRINSLPWTIKFNGRGITITAF